MSSTKKVVTNEKVLKMLLTLLLQVKLYHWETISYSRHKATDSLFGDLASKIDRFVEVYSGRYKRINPKKLDIKVKSLSDKKMSVFLEKSRNDISKEVTKILSSEDTDLLAIRDEMLESINQAAYLFSLK